MNTNQYTKRQNRPNPLVCTGAALLACTLVLGSVVWLFSDAAAAAATVLAQHHASRHA
jgi:hypothetical protein